MPLPGQSTTDPGTRFGKGFEVQRRPLGDRIDRIHAESPQDPRHIHATALTRLVFISSMGIYGEVPGERYRSVGPHTPGRIT